MARAPNLRRPVPPFAPFCGRLSRARGRDGSAAEGSLAVAATAAGEPAAAMAVAESA